MAIHGHQLQGLTPEPADLLTGELSTNLLRMTLGFSERPCTSSSDERR